MALLDDLLEGNRRFIEHEWDERDASLPTPPARRLAVVACMDTRHTVERVLGLEHGDAKIIRNAGNRVDDGTLRSLIIAVHLLEVRTVVIMGHTKCGMTQIGRGQFRVAHSIHGRTGIPLHEVMRPDFQRWLGGFEDVEKHVANGVELIRRHPYMPPDLEVFGLVYDNDTGKVRPVA